MRHIHIPTLVMHLLLLLLAMLTIRNYPDLFLGIAVVVLLIHIAYALKVKKNYLVAHCIGIVLHFLAQYLGIVRDVPDPFGLSGGGFALLLFNTALAVSFTVIALIQLIRFMRF